MREVESSLHGEPNENSSVASSRACHVYVSSVEERRRNSLIRAIQIIVLVLLVLL